MAYELPPDMMELSEAALVAHRRIFSATLQRSEEALDVVAAALSGHLPIFGVRDPQTGLSELTEADFCRGTFCRGATRFEFRDSAGAIFGLGVRKADLLRLLEMLAAPR